MITQLLNTRAKVCRLQKNSNSENFDQFIDVVHSDTIPAIYVYGPNSNGPTFSYTGRIPEISMFCQQFSSLNIPLRSVTIGPTKNKPVFASEADARTAVLNDFIEDIQHRPRPNNAPKPKPHTEARKVTVNIILPDGRTVSREFLFTETVLAVQSFARGQIEPGATFSLFIDDSGEQLPDDPLLPLAQYAPSLTLRARITKTAPKPKQANQGPARGFNWIPEPIRRFYRYVTPFASVDDNPRDFWTQEIPVAQRGRRPRPGKVTPRRENGGNGAQGNERNEGFNAFAGQARHL